MPRTEVLGGERLQIGWLQTAPLNTCDLRWLTSRRAAGATPPSKFAPTLSRPELGCLQELGIPPSRDETGERLLAPCALPHHPPTSAFGRRLVISITVVACPVVTREIVRRWYAELSAHLIEVRSMSRGLVGQLVQSACEPCTWRGDDDSMAPALSAGLLLRCTKKTWRPRSRRCIVAAAPSPELSLVRPPPLRMLWHVAREGSPRSADPVLHG
jgi:hypothetical protein